MARVYDPTATADVGKVTLANLKGMHREEAQRILKQAWDNCDRTLEDLYTGNYPNQNMKNLVELMDLCERFGVPTSTKVEFPKV